MKLSAAIKKGFDMDIPQHKGSLLGYALTEDAISGLSACALGMAYAGINPERFREIEEEIKEDASVEEFYEEIDKELSRRFPELDLACPTEKKELWTHTVGNEITERNDSKDQNPLEIAAYLESIGY